MIEKLPELVNNNEALIRRGRWLNDVFLVEVGEIQYLVHVTAGRVECVETGPSGDLDTIKYRNHQHDHDGVDGLNLRWKPFVSQKMPVHTIGLKYQAEPV